MPRIWQPRDAEPAPRKVRNARPAALRGSSVYPEGRPTAVNVKAVVWPRGHAIPVVQPNRENAIPEVYRREIATQEAQQQAGSVNQAVPLEVAAGQELREKSNYRGINTIYFVMTSSQKPGSFRKNRS